MQVSDKIIRPLTEAKYLNADNVSRYRCIMRIFFENYEKLRYWMYQEDVYEEMIQDPYFADYRPEQCQQDLAMLTEWKNLNAIQDTRKVASIEEFKNRKYRYQMSEYSVEIERLVLRLENLFVEGASLEPTLLERIRRGISCCAESIQCSAGYQNLKMCSSRWKMNGKKLYISGTERIRNSFWTGNCCVI